MEASLDNKDYMDILNLSVKDHILKLEQQLKNIKDDLEQNRKVKNELRLNMTSFGDLNNQQRQEMIDLVKEQSKRLETELAKIVQADKDDVKFLHQQCAQTVEHKIHLEQELLVLESSIIEQEKQLGYKYIFDYLRQQQVKQMI